MFYVKLCLLLTLIGGSAPSLVEGQRTDPTSYSTAPEVDSVPGTDDEKTDGNVGSGGVSLEGGIHRRFQSHMLIVGDPGTGKSQLLKFASTLLPRSVLTTGVGTTGAGLTCSAMRDGADWVLEAGALVLANGGVCCIDEFASIKEQDRVTIHEAMEQQTLSVAKAGLVTKLNTKCSVVAVCNPKGQYDTHLDISTNTNIASPLLSRFDLVLILLDTPQKDWDKQISTFLLNSKVQKGRGRTKNTFPTKNRDGSANDIIDWTLSTLRTYVLLVRDRLHPRLSEPARCLLMRYYQLLRQKEANAAIFSAGSAGRITVRALESSMRLAEAHAKLMFHTTVTFEDAVVAISCMELSSSLTSHGTDKGLALHSGFPPCAAQHYRETEQHILGFLQYSRAMVERDSGFQKDNDDQTKSQLSSQREVSPGAKLQDDAHGSTSLGRIGGGVKKRAIEHMRSPTMQLMPPKRMKPPGPPAPQMEYLTDVDSSTKSAFAVDRAPRGLATTQDSSTLVGQKVSTPHDYLIPDIPPSLIGSSEFQPDVDGVDGVAIIPDEENLWNTPADFVPHLESSIDKICAPSTVNPSQYTAQLVPVSIWNQVDTNCTGGSQDVVDLDDALFEDELLM